jgi:undecaprenyl-diphosphatase
LGIIELLKYLILGIVQGLTEPLPISSSGHLVIFQHLLNIHLPGLDFEIIVNAASLFAISFYFRKDLKELIVHNYYFMFKKKIEFKKDFNYLLLLVLASIPAGFVGLLLKGTLETYKSLLMVGIGLLFTATTLLIVSKLRKKTDLTESISTKKAIWIGLAQSLAIVPGISRSGVTTATSLSNKLSIDEAIKFSFLLFIPISLASLFLSGFEIIQNPMVGLSYVGLIIAFIASLITTYFALKIFVKVLKKQKLFIFSVYCYIVGLLSILFHFIN